ncbi:MAG: hypothetical protein PVG86_09915 [Desulfobacterales bacterium]|jgi:hypothetical protein
MKNIKQIWMVVSFYLLICFMAPLTSTAIAGETPDVSEKSKRSPVTDLTLPDPCIGCFNDPAADSLPTLGPIRILSVYNATPKEFVIIDSKKLKGKENVKAANTPNLFRWLGKFCEASIIDVDEDGDIVGYGFAFIIKF